MAIEPEHDDDLGLIRASSQLLADLEASLPKVLWKTKTRDEQRQLHRYVRRKDLDHLISSLELFQGEPQLLDSKLKVLLPGLLDAYLECTSTASEDPKRSELLTIQVAASRLLYTFCKVRGEKVVSGFFHNEARYLDIILPALERSITANSDLAEHWQGTYCLTLWLSHLLLTPFDLTTISVGGSSLEPITGCPDVAGTVPALARRLVSVLYRGLLTRTRVQPIACAAFVRLINRPDMQKIRLSRDLVPHACKTVGGSFRSHQVGEESAGWLRFLVGLSASISDTQAVEYTSTLWPLSTSLFETLFSETGRSSAIHRKLSIKLLRNIASAGVSQTASQAATFADENGVLEEAIDSLLQATADRDTQVRFAAAKALGHLVSHLDPEMAAQVIEAVLDSYGLDGNVSEGDFSSRDPAKWHGLTLTLAHVLFRRCASPNMLPSIIATLLPALNFEKRAVTGNSLGTNVRDAACFAIWSISRRYTTAELLAVDVTSFQEGQTSVLTTSIQFLATQLMVAACLDPNGNVRRGCSAALQEMIGRHPDKVHEGIALIQIVDYQAVGLRKRALLDLPGKAARLHQSYWTALLDNLLGWRGLGSPDVASRETAGLSLGTLANISHAKVLSIVFDPLVRSVSNSEQQASVEQRHGALCALSSIISVCISESGRATAEVLDSLLGLWREITWDKGLLDTTPRAVAADYHSALLRLLTRLCDLDLCLAQDGLTQHRKGVSDILSRLLSRSDESILVAVDAFTRAAMRQAAASSEVDSLREILPFHSMQRSMDHDGQRPILLGAARAFALAASYAQSQMIGLPQASIVVSLVRLVSAPAIEWRVIGLRCLSSIIHDLPPTEGMADALAQITPAILLGLNDYEITERGDVGSLARIQALYCVQALWQADVKAQTVYNHIFDAVLRLSLEKLDKVRLLAAQTLGTAIDAKADTLSLEDVSSRQYFSTRLQPLASGNSTEHQRFALLRGLASTAGNGAEHLLQAARTALVDTLENADDTTATAVLSSLSTLLKVQVEDGEDTQPALELLAFVLDFALVTGRIEQSFPWRMLLSRVQKAHFKSTVVPKLFAAVEVYRSLAEIEGVRDEVLKKLENMIKSNPFPRVRYSAAEALWYLTGRNGMKEVDWTRSGKQNAKSLDSIRP